MTTHFEEVGHLRGVLVRIIEALELGAIDEAHSFASAALEEPASIPTRRFRCPECGLDFAWPGELDHHLRFSHPCAEVARVA